MLNINNKHSFNSLICMVITLFTSSASGHHGIVNFDLNKDVAFEGVISEIAFINPHTWIYVDVEDSDGTVNQWKCEMRGATVLRRSGWTKDMFEPGTPVAITGAPDRFVEHTCYLGSITFDDGLSMDRYGQLERNEVSTRERGFRRTSWGVPDISGDWASEQQVMTDPQGISGALLPISIATQLEPGEAPMGAFPGARGTPQSLAEDPIAAAWSRSSPIPLTRAGQEAVADFDPASTDNPRLRCEPTNILFDWTFESAPNRIQQEEEQINIQYGGMEFERVVHMRPEFPTILPLTRAGYSIGEWEGDVLVVRTRAFLPGILSADSSIPHSDTLRITERFTLAEDGSSLRREYTATDDLYLEGSYSGGDVVYPSDLPWEPFSCDERSYRNDLRPE